MATKEPGHYTESGTRKYQANGPTSWSATFRKVAGKDGREGEGIRAALAFAALNADKFQAWAESHPMLWAPASTAGAVREAKSKAPKAPRAPKAPKVSKAPKAPKVPKPPKAPKAPKAPKVPKAEQQALPGTEAK